MNTKREVALMKSHTWLWILCRDVPAVEEGRLPGMLASSGFTELDEIRHFTTVFGPLAALKAVKPAGVGK
jgi:hypothetical protein